MPIKCQICQKEFNSLITSTHLKLHDMKTSDYKNLYGDESLASHEYRKKRSNSSKGKNNPNYGNRWDSSQKNYLSERMKGNVPWNKGKSKSEYTEDHIEAIQIGIAHRERKYDTGELSRIGYKRTDVIRKKISLGVIKYAESHSSEMHQRAKKAIATKYKRYGKIVGPMTGKKHSNETKGKLEIIGRRRAEEKISCTNKRIDSLVKSDQLIVESFGDNIVKLKCIECDTKFSYTKQYFTNSKYKPNMCPSCYPRNTVVSKFEIEVRNFIEQFVPEGILYNDRTYISPFELDIVIPDKHIAFECNGLFWHSELNGKSSDYHLMKTELAKKSGLDLYHIWDHEWNEKENLIKSRIKSKLGKTERIYGRNTRVVELNDSDTRQFLENNHIQGWCPSSVRLGLEHNDEIVAIMTFGKSRYDKNVTWELLRYCTKQCVSVTGGPSKLFKSFLINYDGNVVSYADRMRNSGNLYAKLGFDLIHASPESYFYTRDYMIVENRIAYQKHKLKDKLEVFDATRTEWQNMQDNGFDRIWDCGTLKFIYHRRV